MTFLINWIQLNTQFQCIFYESLISSYAVIVIMSFIRFPAALSVRAYSLTPPV